MSLVNNKMGPCLKVKPLNFNLRHCLHLHLHLHLQVEHLQKLLKDRLSPAQARLLTTKK